MHPSDSPSTPTVAPNVQAIVDAHTHLLPARLSAAIRTFFNEEITGALKYPHEPAAARAALIAVGVTRCWSLPYVRRAGSASALNRWMAETFGNDSVVVPGATVHPADEVDAVLDEAFGELALGVVKLHCSVGNFEADDPRLEPLWRRVSASGQPVVVHAGRSIDGTTSAPEIEPIARIAQRWPDARIVVAHCGAPAVDATLALLRSARSVCADLTPVVTAHVSLDKQALAGLEHRLLFGSDAPNVSISIETLIDRIRALDLDAGDQAAILGGNAERLLARG